MITALGHAWGPPIPPLVVSSVVKNLTERADISAGGVQTRCTGVRRASGAGWGERRRRRGRGAPPPGVEREREPAAGPGPGGGRRRDGRPASRRRAGPPRAVPVAPRGTRRLAVGPSRRGA